MNNITILEAVNRFLLEQRLRGNTDKTVKGYKGFLGRFNEYMESKDVKRFHELKDEHIYMYQIFINEKSCERGRNEKLTKKSVQTYMRHIKVFIRYCYEEGFIKDDLSKKIRMPKAESLIIKILTDTEIDEVIKTFKGLPAFLEKRNIAITYLLLDCGLRLSEVARIKYEDINFTKGYIYVFGKGRKERVVPMGEKLREALTDYMSNRVTALNPSDDKYVFLTVRRKPVTEYTLSEMMKTIKSETGIKRIHAHLFRHTFATNYLMYGLGDVYELSRLLGHSDIKITENYLQLASYYMIMQRRDRLTYLDSVKNKRLPG